MTDTPTTTGEAMRCALCGHSREWHGPDKDCMCGCWHFGARVGDRVRVTIEDEVKYVHEEGSIDLMGGHFLRRPGDDPNVSIGARVETADRVARYHSAVRSGASFRRAAEACMALADEESAGLRQRLDAIVRLCDARDVEWSTDPGSVSTAAIRRLAT